MNSDEVLSRVSSIHSYSWFSGSVPRINSPDQFSGSILRINSPDQFSGSILRINSPDQFSGSILRINSDQFVDQLARTPAFLCWYFLSLMKPTCSISRYSCKCISQSTAYIHPISVHIRTRVRICTQMRISAQAHTQVQLQTRAQTLPRELRHSCVTQA